MGIYEELGVTAYINANEWYTSTGGSMLAPPVIQAMIEAAQWTARTDELQDAAGRAIARLTHNEAACVTSSATAGIVLVVAACMSDLDASKLAPLPDSRSMRKDVVVSRCDRFDEDVAIRIPGARIVEIGDQNGATNADYENVLGDETAAVFTTPPRQGMIPLETTVRLAHERGVRVIVDVAWNVPPKENLWKFTREYDVDAVIVSGGKGLRGPQGSGLILGREALVRACQNMVAPHCRIGRPMKLGRETIAGIYAALKHFLNGGAEATQQMAERIARELAGIPGILIRVDGDKSHVYLQFLAPRATARRDFVKNQLIRREPRILVRSSGPDGIRVNAATLAEGQEMVVATQLRALLIDNAE
jgi:D-glucosaminate-6-phosphate ammonia-lyase